MMIRKHKFILLIAASALIVTLWSCSATRQCKEPQLQLPAYISDVFTDSTTIADIEWWKFYGDTTLCHIIRRTLANNRD
ncbi:MAG: TolC family protein, partial [Muribaculaceae bacterium]|nr:TolC family protein [Muribaculaceae bacterium]